MKHDICYQKTFSVNLLLGGARPSNQKKVHHPRTEWWKGTKTNIFRESTMGGKCITRAPSGGKEPKRIS